MFHFTVWIGNTCQPESLQWEKEQLVEWYKENCHSIQLSVISKQALWIELAAIKAGGQGFYIQGNCHKCDSTADKWLVEWRQEGVSSFGRCLDCFGREL